MDPQVFLRGIISHLKSIGDLPLTALSAMYSQPRTLAALDVGCSADSVEFCPFSEYSSLLVCGSYRLQTPRPSTSATDVISEEQGNKRLGGCVLYKWNEEDLKLSETASFRLPRSSLFLLTDQATSVSTRAACRAGHEMVSDACEGIIVHA